MRYFIFLLFLLFFLGFAQSALAVSPDVFPKNPLIAPAPDNAVLEFEDNINPGAPKYNPVEGRIEDPASQDLKNKIFEKAIPKDFPWQAIIWITAISAMLASILVFTIQKFKKE